MTLTILRVVFVISMLGLDTAYLCTKFDDYRDMVGDHQNLNGSRDLTIYLSWMICHPWAGTCYNKPTDQI